MSKSVEDLVKVALKEAIEKRVAATDAPSPLIKGMVDTLSAEKAFVEPKDKKTFFICKDGQKFLSDVLGVSGLDENFPITCFFEYDWDSKVSSFVPSIRDDYTFDIDQATAVLRAWELNEKVLCYGPTGAGKSSLIEQLCARTGRPFIRVNCTGDMDSSMIFGQLTAKDGSTVWIDGPVTEAVKYGAVFAWDEWDVTPPEISMGLQWLLEDKGKLFLKDMPGTSTEKMLVPHENFRIVAIGNTQGQGDDTGAHAGTNVQNSATLDRFGTAVFVDYMPQNEEVKMLAKSLPDVFNASGYKKLVQLAGLVRQGYQAGQLSLTMSPRTLLNICNKVRVGVDLQPAFGLVYLNKLNETQKKVAVALFEKVYPKKS